MTDQPMSANHPAIPESSAAMPLSERDLKPCPFCGEYDGEVARTSTPNITHGGMKIAVYCNGCFSEGPLCNTAAEAIEAWNHRSIPDAEPAAEQETDRDWSQAQDWKDMDGATAWLLINRHADGWGDTRAMMEAWRDANHTDVSPAATQAPYLSKEAGKRDTSLGFVIEGGTLRYTDGGCHPATDTELAMWEALQRRDTSGGARE